MQIPNKFERVWTGVSRTFAEDSVLSVYLSDAGVLTAKRFSILTGFSFMILLAYFMINAFIWPEYQIIKPGAENEQIYMEKYPPFRESEWEVYQLSNEILRRSKPEEFTTRADYSPGLSLLSVPLTSLLGEKGPYFTNAVILWISALILFFIVFDMISFKLGIFMMIFAAFGTPNLFYAASAFPEPPSQLLVVSSLFAFWRAYFYPTSRMWYLLAGFLTSLNLFVLPLMAFTVLLFAAVVLARGKNHLSNLMDFSTLGAGFGLGVFPGMKIFGNLPPLLGWIGISASQETSLLSILWVMTVASPRSLLALMPVAMLFPLGLSMMWNSPYRKLALLTGTIVLLGIVSSTIYWIGDGIMGSGILSVAPLVLIPLPFIWNLGKGVRTWLVLTAVFTFYICGFGWWYRPVGSKTFGTMFGDPYSSSIILARKGMLAHPPFKSSKHAAEEYFSSLKTGNLRKWLQTTDPYILEKFAGSERELFHILSDLVSTPSINPEDFILSADPDRGIRPRIPKELISQ